MRRLDLRQHLRRAAGDEVAALVAGAGAEVDDPVGVLDEVEVVLDEQDGVALVNQPVQDAEQRGAVLEGQAGGGFVQQVEGAPGGTAGQLRGQLDALGLASR